MSFLGSDRRQVGDVSNRLGSDSPGASPLVLSPLAQPHPCTKEETVDPNPNPRNFIGVERDKSHWA